MICTVQSFPLIIREDHSWTPAAFDSVQTDLSFLHRLSIVQVLGIKGLSENVYSSMDGKGVGKTMFLYKCISCYVSILRLC